VLSTKLHDTLACTAIKNKMIWFWSSTNETHPCTSVQHGATETMDRSHRLYIYTGYPRRNVKHFGRVFLMLNYTNITQNTYIQS